MRIFRDKWGDTVKVTKGLGVIRIGVSCDVLFFSPDEALKLAAAIRDAAILAKEKA